MKFYEISEKDYLALLRAYGGLTALFNVTSNTTDNTYDEAISSIHECICRVIDGIDHQRGYDPKEAISLKETK